MHMAAVTHMEPVDGAAADEGGKHPQSAAKGVPNGAHCQDNMEVLADPFYKQVVHGQWGGLDLPSLCVGGRGGTIRIRVKYARKTAWGKCQVYTSGTYSTGRPE